MKRKQAMKQEEPKQPTYELVERDCDPVLYEMLDRLVADHHDDLAEADIAIAWRFGWKSDPDGRLQLGQLRKASELDRQLHAHDFVMLLNWEVWDAANFSDEQKRALIDHELSHGALALDAEYEPKENAAGKKLYRMRKHDIEEFAAVVERHGLWKHELQHFAQVAMEAKALPLFADEDDQGQDNEARAEALATSRVLRSAVEKLRPRKGSGVDSLTISTPDGQSAVLHAR